MELSTPVPDSPIDLNDITRDQLHDRCGLAPEVSDSIVAFREEHGHLTSIEQLLDVPGIDSSVLDALRQCVYIAAPGEAALPAPDMNAPDQEQPLAEQVGPSQPDLEEVPPASGTGPAESGGAEDSRSEEVGDASSPENALAAPLRALEPAPESGEPRNEWVNESSLESEPVTDAAITEALPEQDLGEPEPMGAAQEAIATDDAAVDKFDLRSGTTDELADAAPIGVGDGETEAKEGRSECGPSDQENPATFVLIEPIKAEASSDQAEERPAVVEAHSAPQLIPECVESQPEDSRSATEPVASSDAAAKAPAPVRRRSVWHDVGMIVLGGLAGALLTLVILGGMGGTLSYAPRRLVDALSQNMSIMQENQVTTWSQLQTLSSRADALEKRLGVLETLETRVAELESGSAAMDAQLGELSQGVDQLSASLASLESTHAALIQGLDTRLGSQERDLDALGETVGALGDTVQQMQDMVGKYESFFDALRDLLINMQGDAVAEAGA